MSPFKRNLNIALIGTILGSIWFWFSTFPIKTPFDIKDIIFESANLITALVIFYYIIKIDVRPLSFGWALLLINFVLDLMDEFTKETALWNTMIPGFLMVVGMVLIIIGFYLALSIREQAKKAIEQRRQYLSSLNEGAKLLLGSSDKVPYQEYVEKIGPASEMSRVYIVINRRNSRGKLEVKQKAEWCAEGVVSSMNNTPASSQISSHWFAKWYDKLAAGEDIRGQLNTFPQEERLILEQRKTLSILLIPFSVEGEFLGFIGLDNCKSSRDYNEDEYTLINKAATDLSQAIRRARSEKQIKSSLEEKEVLLREIHHRVKNNMQVIVSLMGLHSNRTESGRVRDVFEECRDRIHAMSLVHEALYQSEDLSQVDYNNYLKKLCLNLGRVHKAEKNGIKIQVEEGNVSLNMDQGIAVGMVISELLPNAFKHAFSHGTGGLINVSLLLQEDQVVELTVQDNGQGLPAEIDITNVQSFGLQLAVLTVIHDLEGRIDVERNGGTKYIIRFKQEGIPGLRKYNDV